MGKILPKKKSFKSSVYTHVQNGYSHVDSVRNSLENLIFLNERETERTLFKKRIKVIIVVTILLMIVSSFFTPKGKAEVAIFYPTACLGGWVNPRNAEGEPQTKSNGEESQFSKDNSSVLPSTVQADIYCGNFVGEIEQNTKPTKIIVSLAWSKGEDVVVEQKIISDSFASSSLDILDSASTTEVSFTLASSTENSSTSSLETTEVSTTTQETSIVNQVMDTLGRLFGGDGDNTSTSTSIVPVTEITPSTQATSTSVPDETATTSLPQVNVEEIIPQQTPSSESATDTVPVSFFNTILEKFASRFIQKVFAEEVASSTDTSGQTQIETSTTTTTPQVFDILPEQDIVMEISTTTIPVASGTEIASSDTGTTSLIMEVASTTESTSTPSFLEQALSIVVDSNTEDESPNNFLELLYTFDGNHWNSLGRVNEASMKYRTFEIPITATTSWSDIAQLQIKLQPMNRVDMTPAVYLDGIKLEVLYETPVIHEHPDFVRDTVLQDKSDDGIRVVSIINSDTNTNEIWYTTIGTQADYGVAPDSWVQVVSEQKSFPYRLVNIYGQNIFLVDDVQKLLWVKNLKKETNDGIGIVEAGTTTAQFTKSNGEEWIFEYNNVTKDAVVKIKQ